MKDGEQQEPRPDPAPEEGEKGEPGVEAPRVEGEPARPEPAAAGKGEEADRPPPPALGDLEPAALIEALIFSAGETLTVERLAGATGLEPTRVRELLGGLEERLETEGRPYRLGRVGRGWRLLTRPEYHPFIARLLGIRKGEGLSRAAL